MRASGLFSFVFIVLMVVFVYIGFSKIDFEPPRMMVDEPKAYTSFVASEGRVTIHIVAMISDDKAIRRISVELYGKIRGGETGLAGLLYSIKFDKPGNSTVSIDDKVTASLGNSFVVPGWFYVRFFVEDFMGNVRVVRIGIYVDV